MNPEDPVKVAAKLNALNTNGVALWVAADGYNAITRMELQDDGSIAFNPSVGVPTKVFVNQATGEIKLFDARTFGRD